MAGVEPYEREPGLSGAGVSPNSSGSRLSNREARASCFLRSLVRKAH